MDAPRVPSDYYRVGPVPEHLFIPDGPSPYLTLPPDEAVTWEEARQAQHIQGSLVEPGPHLVHHESWRPVMEALDATTLHDTFRQIVWTPVCQSMSWRTPEPVVPERADPGFPLERARNK